MALGGGPDTLLTNRGREVILFPLDGGQPRRIWRARGTILALSLSPDGQQIAVLVEEQAGPAIVVLDRTGKVVAQYEELDQAVAPKMASPEPGSAGPGSIAWSPDGKTLLAALPAGGIVQVATTSSKPVVLVGRGRAKASAAITWSPDGKAIAYLDPAGEGMAAGIAIAAYGKPPLDPVVVLPPDPSARQTIRDVTWSADGDWLFYLTGPVNRDLSLGGDVFALPARGGAPRLLAASGWVAPVAAIDRFALAPGGKAIAFTVVAPGDDGQPRTTLWVQQVDGTTLVDVPVPHGMRITGLWWTANGLIYRTEPLAAAADAEETPFTLVRVNPDRSTTILFDSEASAATPEASPVGTPATPPAPSAMQIEQAHE